MLPKSSHSIWLKSIHSFILLRILNGVCVLIDVECRVKCSQDVARQGTFPGIWPDIVANICNLLLKMSEGSVSSKTEGKRGKGEEQKDYVYAETNIREEIVYALVLGQTPILLTF